MGRCPIKNIYYRYNIFSIKNKYYLRKGRKNYEK